MEEVHSCPRKCDVDTFQVANWCVMTMLEPLEGLFPFWHVSLLQTEDLILTFVDYSYNNGGQLLNYAWTLLLRGIWEWKKDWG